MAKAKTTKPPKRRPRGRPPESDEDKRSKMVWVRVTEQEHAEWTTTAKSLRMALSTWARFVLNQEAARAQRGAK